MKQRHKKHSFHLRRIGLFGLLFAAFFIVRVDAGAIKPDINSKSGSVLAYATDMSRSGLLSGTNAARSSNGLGALGLSSQLNNSAQAKAQHMADLNYWAHVAPDGTEPWYFFDQAGYTYVRAGENLAYGFSTSQGTVDGWMNSASHRANILGDYVDIGFGIVNTPDYQNSGQQTIVVAHYGTRAMTAPAPAPTPAPTQSSPPSSPATTQPAPEPAPLSETTPPAAPESEQSAPAPPEAKEAVPTNAQTQPATSDRPVTAPVTTGSAERVSILGMIASRSLPIAALVSLSMVFVSILGYAMTHRAAMHHAVTSGEHFVMTHPGVDAGIVAAMTTLIVLTTYGNIG